MANLDGKFGWQIWVANLGGKFGWQIHINNTLTWRHCRHLQRVKIDKAKSDKVLMAIILKYMSVRIMHCARVLLFSYGKFHTTNNNKNIQFGIFVLWKTTK